jgi:hypothetical protein
MNEDEVAAWRLYLNEIVRRKTAAEKKLLYEAVQVSRSAFQRWRNGEGMPDAAHAALLLKALPQEERERLQALMQNDPQARLLLPQEAIFLDGQAPDRIPQEVYEEVLRLARDAPDRWLLCSAILFHALMQLETHPQQTGVELSVARCMPPRHDGKIRSLRAYAGRGTPPWRGDLHAKAHFLGAESLAGYAVMQRHGMMVPDRNSSESVAPVQWIRYEMSCAAFPIMREGSIAGALIVSSCAPGFFSQEKLTLIEKYADLIRLAFYDHEFYPAASIDLGLMPSWIVQQQHLCSFRRRVNEEYKRALREEQSLQDLAQVEEHVRAAFEEEFLQLASQPDKEVTV